MGKIIVWSVLGLLILCVIVPASLRADLYYEQVTELSGGLVDLLNKTAIQEKQGMIDSSVLAIYIKKKTLRIDSFVGKEMKKSMICSLSRQEMILLDHDYHSYEQTTFEQFKKLYPPPKKGSSARPPKEGGSSLNLSTSLQDLAEETTINGFLAHHYKVATKYPVLEESAASGEFEMLSDLWLCKDRPGLSELEQFRNELLLELGESAEAKSLLPPLELQQDVHVQMGLREIWKLAIQMDATPIRIISYLNAVPPQFSPNGGGDSPGPSSGRKHALGKASPAEEPRSSAASADGLAGNGADKEESPILGNDQVRASETKFSRHGIQVMKVTRELRKINTSSLDDTLFEVPKNYNRGEK